MNVLKTVCVLVSVAVLAGCHGLPVKDHKQAVCHKGKTIYVDDSAVQAHIRHGDYGRACYGEKKEHDQKDRHDRDDD